MLITEVRSDLSDMCSHINKSLLDGIFCCFQGCESFYQYWIASCFVSTKTPIRRTFKKSYLKKYQGKLSYNRKKTYDVENPKPKEQDFEKVPPHSIRMHKFLSERRQSKKEKNEKKSPETSRSPSSEHEKSQNPQFSNLVEKTEARTTNHLRYRHESHQPRIMSPQSNDEDDSFILL